MRTMAMLNNGLQMTLCTERLASRLEVAGSRVSFAVISVNDRATQNHGRQVDLTVRPVSGGKTLVLKKTWTVR